MSKVKMRCGRCGKTFTAPKGAKQIFCNDCVAKEKAARNAAKATAAKPAAAPAQAPRIVGPGASILDPRLAAPAAAAPPAESGLFGAAARAAEREAARESRGHPSDQRHDHGHVRAHEATSHAHGTVPAVADKRGKPEKGDKSTKQHKTPPPVPRRPKAPPLPPFELTNELRAQIEARYLELAQPTEFDGIRTQLAGELHVPKMAVKKAVADLRARMQLPSWWDLKAYHGSEDDLERIRVAYLPLLPVPAVGAHKQLAGELGLEPSMVYQGIRRIRAEMRLPQYNPPELHDGEQLRSAAASAPVGGV
jgi:hypothetical protein